MKVLDYGFIELDGSMADDLSVVNSARVSFGKRKDEMDEGDRGLINFLIKNRHGTPFEHNSFRFHVACPIFVMREWIRHRIGSFNEFSARYTEMERNLFYLPEAENVRCQVGKVGAYTFVPAHEEVAEQVRKIINDHSVKAFALYREMINAGIAKEVARFVLPVNVYTEFYWTVNARSLMNFISLRNAPQAMWEIQQYAQGLESFFAEAMPATYRAFVDNDRVAP